MIHSTSAVRLAFAMAAAITPFIVNASAGDTAALPHWMAGDWCNDSENSRSVERWMAPDGELMLGLSRTVADGRKTQFEYMRITLVDGVPTFIAQPNGVPPTAFKRVDGGSDWIRFEQPAHDFPQRVEYRRIGNALHAEIAGPGNDGQTMTIEFEFTTCSK